MERPVGVEAVGNLGAVFYHGFQASFLARHFHGLPALHPTPFRCWV